MRGSATCSDTRTLRPAERRDGPVARGRATLDQSSLPTRGAPEGEDRHERAVPAATVAGAGGLPHDSGVDAGLDAGLDAGTDAGLYAGTDAGTDAGTEAGVARREAGPAGGRRAREPARVDH